MSLIYVILLMKSNFIYVYTVQSLLEPLLCTYSLMQSAIDRLEYLFSWSHYKCENEFPDILTVSLYNS